MQQMMMEMMARPDFQASMRGMDAEPPMPGSEGRSELFDAAGAGDLKAVKALVASGAQVDHAPNSHGYTPACHAAMKGHLPVLEFLGEAGADLIQEATDGFSTRPSDGSTPVGIAMQGGHVDVVRFLADKGADLNRNMGGPTGAIIAAQQGHLPLLRFLGERGAGTS